MDPTFDRIARLAAHSLRVPIAAFALLANPNRIDEGVELPGAVGLPGPIQRARQILLPDTVTAQVVAMGEPRAVALVAPDPLVTNAAAQVGVPLGAVAAYPLFAEPDDQGAVGALIVAAVEPRRWSHADLETLRDMAELGSSELRLRRGQDRALDAERKARQAQQDAQLLLAMSEAFADVTTAREVESALAAVARNSLGAVSARLAIVQPDGRSIGYVSAGPGPVDSPQNVFPISADLPVCAVARIGRSQFYSSAALLRREYPMLSEQLGFSGACLLLPVRSGERVRAVICLGWADAREFDHAMAAVETGLGPFVAHAVDRVLLFEARRTVATTLQSAMLSAPPEVPGLEIATTYAPARRTDSVGGDWYDAVVVDENTTVLVIGDVAGHDVRAAANMGQLRSILRALAWSHQQATPAKLLTMLDQANASLGPHADASAIVVRLRKSAEPGTYEITWANAGHLPPMLLRADGTVTELDARADLILGLVPETARANHQTTLGPGETLLLYTDGLVETRGESLRERIDQLRDTLSASATTATPSLPSALVRTLVHLPLQDDVAVLAVRSRNPVPLAERVDSQPMPVLQAHREITDDVADLSPTRRWLDDILEADGLPLATRQTATLLANELVTNAVRHAVEPISATVQLDPNAGTLKFSVSDGSPEHPILRYPEPQETSGRGVQLVARLASHWGVTDAAPGKTVWFELPLGR